MTWAIASAVAVDGAKSFYSPCVVPSGIVAANRSAPVAKAVLLDNRATSRNPDDRDAGFRVLMVQYGIKPTEFFLVGEAMEQQWQSLFASKGG